MEFADGEAFFFDGTTLLLFSEMSHLNIPSVPGCQGAGLPFRRAFLLRC
jgi:hypothetical protein